MPEFEVTSMQFNHRSRSVTGTFRVTGDSPIMATNRMIEGKEMPEPPSRVLTQAAEDILNAICYGKIATAADAAHFLREQAAARQAESGGPQNG